VDSSKWKSGYPHSNDEGLALAAGKEGTELPFRWEVANGESGSLFSLSPTEVCAEWWCHSRGLFSVARLPWFLGVGAWGWGNELVKSATLLARSRRNGGDARASLIGYRLGRMDHAAPFLHLGKGRFVFLPRKIKQSTNRATKWAVMPSALVVHVLDGGIIH
jgi:hypothetical protein